MTPKYTDKQSLFDAVATHLLKQGKPAITHGHCKYRTPDGLACGIGGLIPDDDVARFLDHSCLTVEASEVLEAAGISRDLSEFASALQMAHDGFAEEGWLANWRAEMFEIAKHHNLSTEVLG